MTFRQFSKKRVDIQQVGSVFYFNFTSFCLISRFYEVTFIPKLFMKFVLYKISVTLISSMFTQI